MESGEEIYSTGEDEDEEVAAEEEAAAEEEVAAAAPSPPPAALQHRWCIAAQIELAQVLPAESSIFIFSFPSSSGTRCVLLVLQCSFLHLP